MNYARVFAGEKRAAAPPNKKKKGKKRPCESMARRGARGGAGRAFKKNISERRLERSEKRAKREAF